MKKIFLPLLIAFAFSACRNDDSYKPDEPDPTNVANIPLSLTTRVGTTVGDPLTQYVKSLHLLLFRENESGNYVLYRTTALNKTQLEALANNSGQVDAGFTNLKEFTFDSVPIANYQIVGIGNITDSTGNTLRDVSLQGAVVGNEMSQILAVVTDGSESSRLFLGTTGIVRAGATESNPPVLKMYRKVAMFALTLDKIPDVVNQISMRIENTYGSFDMAGTYTPGRSILVDAIHSYSVPIADSITLSYITLPTVSGDRSSFLATFYLIDGPKQQVMLPEYILKPNTITKVTATIDTEQPGNIWKVNIGTIITVDVEWNVDQEPPITI